MEKATEEIVEFIARGTTPANVIAFQPSDANKARVGDLIRRHKNSGLSEDEQGELDHYLQLEHLMRLVKARALCTISNSSGNS